MSSFLLEVHAAGSLEEAEAQDATEEEDAGGPDCPGD